jgi:CheY-like chemotaxis protein
MKRILLLDDSLTIQKVVKLTFTNSVEFEVRFAQSRKEASELLEQTKPDVVIAYIRFGGEAKPEYFLELRKHCPSILLLAESNEVLTSFEQAGFANFLRKPFLREELKSAVQGLLPLAYSKIPPLGNEFTVTELDDQPTQAAGAVKSGVFPGGLPSIPRPPSAPPKSTENDATISRVTLNIPPPPPSGNLGPRTTFSSGTIGTHTSALGNTALAPESPPMMAQGLNHSIEEVPPSFRSTLSIPDLPPLNIEVEEKPALSFVEATEHQQLSTPSSGESRFSVSLVSPLASPPGQTPGGSAQAPMTNPLVRTTYAPTSVPSISNGAVPEGSSELSKPLKPSFKPAFEVPEVTMDLEALERSYKATMTAKQAPEMPPASTVKATYEDKRFVDINAGGNEGLELKEDTNAVLGFDSLVLEVAENLETQISAPHVSRKQSRPEIVIEPAVEPTEPLILEDVSLRTKPLNAEKPLQSKAQPLNLEEMPFPNHWRKEVEHTIDDALFRALERAVPAKIDQKIEHEWPQLVTTVTNNLVKELKETIPDIVEKIITQELQIFRPRLEEIVHNEARALHTVHLKKLETTIQSEVEKNVASQVKVWLAAEAIHLAKDIVKEEIRLIMSEN